MYFDKVTNIYVPSIFALLNIKLETIYKEIFNYILENLLCRNFKEKIITITCYFEIGLINSIKEVFKNARLVGCYFHFLQSLVRNAKKLGFRKSNYRNDILELLNKK